MFFFTQFLFYGLSSARPGDTDGEIVQIRNVHGICLDAPGRCITNRQVHMWDCDTNQKNQMWWIDYTTGKIEAAFGNRHCLDVPSGNRRERVKVYDCISSSNNQKFYFDEQHQQIKIHGNCVDAPRRNERGSEVHMWSCDENNLNQRWTITPIQTGGEYQGCYENRDEFRVSGHIEHKSYKECWNLALRRGVKFFGMENGVQCLLLESEGQFKQMPRTEDSECEVTGVRSGRRFGGSYRVAVYRVDDILHERNPTRMPYNEVRQKSSHNSYERSEALIDQLQYHRIRSLELDIWRDKRGSATRDGDWFVYHNPQTATTCHRLSDCLKEFKAFHDAVPEHEVITVFVDLKNGHMFGAWDRDDMDRLLRNSGLPLYTPGQLRGGAPTLREGVRSGWPRLNELRGKFIFVMTDNVDSYCNSNHECNDAAAFRHCSLTGNPDDITHHGGFCVFYNQGCGGRSGENLRRIHDEGYVSRCFRGDDVNSRGEWWEAANNKANHIATDQVNLHEDPDITSHNEVGWPFESTEGLDTRCVMPLTDVIGASVNSGDIWGRHDDFMFSYMREHEEGKWVDYTVMVSNVNSHVEDFAKAGIMVRREIGSKNSGESSPYMAIIRNADAKRVRVQWRNGHRHNSHEQSRDIAPFGDSIDQESRCFLRLRVKLERDRTEVQGFASQNGKDWQHIYSSGFEGKFTYVGLSSSSHNDNGNRDGTIVKHLYTNFKKDGRLVRAGELTTLNVGNDVSAARLYDGIFHRFDIRGY